MRPAVRYYRGDTQTFDAFIGALAFSGQDVIVTLAGTVSSCTLDMSKLPSRRSLVHELMHLKVVFRCWTVFFWMWRLDPVGTCFTEMHGIEHAKYSRYNVRDNLDYTLRPIPSYSSS